MPGPLTVLLVEANPMVQGLLRQALQGFTRVLTARSAAEALQQSSQTAPDLVITDYRLGNDDGAELARELRGRGKSAAAILLATRSDLQGPLAGAREAFDDVIEKPFFTREAVARIRRVVDRITLERGRAARADTRLGGSLAQMSVIDLLQTLEMGRKTCALVLSTPSGECQMFFTEGQIVHATSGDLSGDAAVFQAVGWSGSGSFEIDFEARSSRQTTTRSTQSLLMEGLRLLDEANRDEVSDEL